MSDISQAPATAEAVFYQGIRCWPTTAQLFASKYQRLMPSELARDRALLESARAVLGE